EGIWEFVFSPDGTKVYATSWAHHVYTFSRSPVNGSLAKIDDASLFNASGIAITPDGAHLYTVGSNNRFHLRRYDIDPVTGKPVHATGIPNVYGGELAIAAGGAHLFESSGGDMGIGIVSYFIDPITGALTGGPVYPHDSKYSHFMFVADDE